MRSNKKRKRKKKINLKTIVIILVAILIAIGIGFIVKGCNNTMDYKDKESFEKFAAEEFKNINKENYLDLETKENISYDEAVSKATFLPKVDNEFIKTSIDDFEKQLNLKIGKYEKEQFFANNKYERAAFITGYKTFQGSKDTGSILITTEHFEKLKNEKLEKRNQEVMIFNFLNEKYTPLTFNNVFNPEKRYELVKFLQESLEKDYKDNLYENYTENLKNSNLDRFILNGKDAEFIFEPNTLVKSEDLVRIKLSDGDIKGLFRDEIKVRDIDPSKPMVALTFDDGPDPVYTEEIIDILDKHNGVGTFYLVGQKLETVNTSDRILKKLMDKGHEIGTHSYDHSNLFTLTDKQVKAQNDKTDKIIKDISGAVATTYRPPYGNGNDNTTKIFNKAGILWSIDTQDWKTRNKDSIVNEIKKTKDLNGHVILMHSIYDFSAKATKEIVPWLEKQGYQMVTVSELLQYKYNVNPQEKKFYGYGFFHTLSH